MRSHQTSTGRAALAGALATATVVIGCGDDPDRSSTAPAGSAATAASSPGSTSSRTCAIPPRVPGQPPAHWRQDSAAIGAIHLYAVAQYRNMSAREFAPLDGTNGKRYRGSKVLIIVKSSTPVTLAIAAQDRPAVSLMYNNTPFDNGYALSDGTPSVTFGRGGMPVTQWSGAFIVAGPRCVALVARDRGVVVGRRRVPFGTHQC